MGVLALLIVPWLIIQGLFFKVFIFHDAWKHNFPIAFRVAREASCGDLPRWLGGVDTGSPTVLYVMGQSLTQVFRLPTIFLMSCLGLDPLGAVYVYKVQILVAYVAFAASMYVLGRVLFHHRASALFLLVATLYAGLLLDASHSDQVISIVFWLPWIVVGVALYHRHSERPQGSVFLLAAISIAGAPILDQYPHFLVLAAAVGATLYVILTPATFSAFLRLHLLRLGPAVLVVAAVVFQLLTVRSAIAEYVPSLRAALAVDPKQFGETGFVQPTALIGSLLPLGFLAGFDPLGDNMARWLSWTGVWPGRAFIYRLDLLLFNIGFIPAVFAAVFLCQPGCRRLKLGWSLFALTVLLVSIQQTGFYLVLFRLPFFDLFRSYFLFVVIVVFAVLVMSGYGFDTWLSAASAEARRRLLLRGLAVVLVGVTIAFVSILGLASLGLARSVIRAISLHLLLDFAGILAGTIVLLRHSANADVQRLAVRVIVVAALSQTAYLGVAYALVGVPEAEIVRRWGLSSDDFRSTPPTERKECRVFAECYLSLRDTVSLRTDLDGTFLRHHQSPLFQPDLERRVATALLGLSHPPFWLSRTVAVVRDAAELTQQMNIRGDDPGPHLRAVSYLAEEIRPQPATLQTPGEGQVTMVRRTRDHVLIEYQASGPAFLNAAITYDPHWQAQVNGVSTVLRRGNFNGLLIAVPPGDGRVELSYRWPRGDVFFLTRYACLMVAVALAAWLSLAALRGEGGR